MEIQLCKLKLRKPFNKKSKLKLRVLKRVVESKTYVYKFLYEEDHIFLQM